MDKTESVRPQITAELMAHTGIDEAALELMVRRFHDQVRADPLLGPIIAAHTADWPAHLSKMVSFWSSVALMTGQYHGAAMARHLSLPIGQVHFDRWLRLFRQMPRETCDPVGAAWLIERAERIAHAIMTGIRKARSHPVRDSLHPGIQEERRDD